MKVGELIEKLQKLDPELYVSYYDGDFGDITVTNLEVVHIPRLKYYDKDQDCHTIRNAKTVVLE